MTKMVTVIIGGPKTGKTTLANKLSPDAKHTDDTIPEGWDKSKHTVKGWLGTHEVIEGVQAPRALRQWLRDNPTGKPCDQVIVLSSPQAPQTKAQEAMSKAVNTVFNEIRHELVNRGVEIVQGKT